MPKYPLHEIAVVGVSVRFPGALTPTELWALLSGTASVVRPFESPFFDINTFYNPDPTVPNTTYVTQAAGIGDVTQFDPEFFNILPREAAVLDPIQRLVLMDAWRALEDAGITRSEIAATVGGVILGCTRSEYFDMMHQANVPYQPATFVGNLVSCIAGRVAHYLNLSGPVFTVDTACSSSATATHLAISHLVTGQADWMIAGGTNLILSETLFLAAAQAKILSTDGTCRVFDQSANGTGLGEGIGLLVLKRLPDALRDKNQIYGIIQASAINHEGHTNGMGAPSRKSQHAVQQAVYDGFGISPESIGYVEAHGSGTAIGDFVEFSALTDAFRSDKTLPNRCAIGSVKTKINHCMGASGIAGLIKALLCLRFQTIPPHDRFETINPHIDLANSPFFINTQPVPFPTSNGPARAAVNSVGLSGTNVHFVLEAAPTPPAAHPKAPNPLPVLFSGKRPMDVRQKIIDLLDWMDKNPTASFDDIAFTATMGRSVFKHRVGFFVSSNAALTQALNRWLSDPSDQPVDPDPTMPLWVSGKSVDWSVYFIDKPVKIISLPTYPFMLTHHWAPPYPTQRPEKYASGSVFSVTPKSVSVKLESTHPLIVQHVVQDTPIVAGAVQIQIILDSLGLNSSPSGLTLHNIQFMKPLDGRIDRSIDVNHRNPIHQIQDGDWITTQIESIDVNPSLTVPPPPGPVGVPHLISAHQFEHELTQKNLDHGPLYQVVGDIQATETWASSRLTLQSAWTGIANPNARWIGFLDGAFQIAAVVLGQHHPSQLAIPVAVTSIWRVSHAPTGPLTAIAAAGPVIGNRPSADIWLLDNSKPVMWVRGFQLAARGGKSDPSMTLWTTSHTSHPVPMVADDGITWDVHPWQDPADYWPVPKPESPIPNRVRVTIPDAIDPLDLLDTARVIVQKVNQWKAHSPIRLEWWVSQSAPARVVHLLTGVAKTVTKECPSLWVTVRQDDARQLVPNTWCAAVDLNQCQAAWAPLVLSDHPVPIQPNGWVVVTGATGVIGRRLVKALVHRHPVNVLAIGRSSNPDLSEWESVPSDRIRYVSIPTPDAPLIRATLEQLDGPVTGVFHLAGALSDGWIPALGYEDLTRCLTPKLSLALALDEATANQPIAYFVAFSSLAGSLGNPGQFAYAAANAALDGWLLERQSWVDQGLRSGRCLSIAWPLWADGGMTPGDEWLDRLIQRFGSNIMIDSDHAFRIMETLMTTSAPYVAVVPGGLAARSADDLVFRSLTAPPVAGSGPALDPPPIPLETLRQQVLDEIRDMLSTLFQIRPSLIDYDTDIQELGLDSIAVMDLVEAFFQRASVQLNPSIFFMLTTMGELVDHVIETDLSKLTAYFQTTGAPDVTTP